jgi:hypothetical protein
MLSSMKTAYGMRAASARATLLILCLNQPASAEELDYYHKAFPVGDGICECRVHTTGWHGDKDLWGLFVKPKSEIRCRSSMRRGEFVAARSVQTHVEYGVADHTIYFTRAGKRGAERLFRVEVNPSCSGAAGEREIGGINLGMVETFPGVVASGERHYLVMCGPDRGLRLVGTDQQGRKVLDVALTPQMAIGAVVIEGAMARVFWVKQDTYDGEAKSAEPLAVHLSEVNLEKQTLLSEKTIGAVPIERGPTYNGHYKVENLVVEKRKDHHHLFFAYNLSGSSGFSGGIKLVTYGPMGAFAQRQLVVGELHSELVVAPCGSGYALAWRVGNSQIGVARADAQGMLIGHVTKYEGNGPFFMRTGGGLWLCWEHARAVQRRRVTDQGLQ